MFNAELIVTGARPPGAALGVLRTHTGVAQRLKFSEGILQSHGRALRRSGRRFGLRRLGIRRLLGCHFLCHGYLRPMMAAQMMETDSDRHHPPEWARVTFITRNSPTAHFGRVHVLRVLVTDDPA